MLEVIAFGQIPPLESHNSTKQREEKLWINALYVTIPIQIIKHVPVPLVGLEQTTFLPILLSEHKITVPTHI